MIIDNKYYKVNDNEYSKIIHTEFNNLRLYNELSIHERIIGFIIKLKQLSFIKNTLISVNTTHGGFIPINVSKYFDDVYFLDTDNNHVQNIETNIVKYNVKNIFEYNNNLYNNISSNELLIILNLNNCNIQKYNSLNNTIVISYNFDKNINYNNNFVCYKFNNIELYVYISNNLFNSFELVFKYFIQEKQNISEPYDKIIVYDNLINLCIMVKNAGTQFRDMLIDNLPIIDKWTILDTGSTDETISIIEDVLVGKKEGNLYQEPFINFRDSRNRLLDLAGDDCKYILMLDDTYIINGNLRGFLNEVRGDQLSTSFTLFIHRDDTEYGSNRIIKSNSGLRYIHKIHEVITDKDNINIVIPNTIVKIIDRHFDYMENRTMNRKQLDLQLLYEEVEDNPTNPRTYYYLAQTYNLIQQYDKAYYYFLKRAEFTNSGFIQERVDALFEAARTANFKLNKPWSECLALYEKCYKVDESRPDAIYFIGIHYYLKNDFETAYKYFKLGFEIGFPSHCQYSLKPIISFHFLPKFLAKICYQMGNYKLGEAASHLFLLKNDAKSENYVEMVSWYNIYKKLNMYTGDGIPKLPKDKPIFCFHVDGEFNKWSDKNIITTGVGGSSETYIIEMARYIQQSGLFEVFVFCNCEESETFEDVKYKPLNDYYAFVNENYIHTCIVSRFSEYLPVTFKGWVENVYLDVHDLLPSGIVIPIDNKLKQIFCLTEWHVEYMSNFFPALKHLLVSFYHGGIIIEGDPMNELCQNDAIQKYVNHQNVLTNESIKENYECASSLSWESQALKLLNQYILPRKLEYKEMFNWDLNKGLLSDVIAYYNSNYNLKYNREKISSTRVLEIGTHTGISLINIVKQIPNSCGVGIDTWFLISDSKKNIEKLYIEQTFYNNLKREGLENKIRGIKGDSTKVLLNMIKNNELFDFIYIDLGFESLTDTILAWQVLSKNGILAVNNPYSSVFLDKYVDEYKILYQGTQLYLEKA
jgi:hypothetical protein